LIPVRVNRKGADRVASGHPWVFSSDVTDRGGAEPGAAVQVLDPKGRPLGLAHYSESSQICLRMLSRKAEEAGPAFFAQRLQAAEAHRLAVVSGTDA
jgi:23S rRNA (cytosine1962-C5)-methyltransferase